MDPGIRHQRGSSRAQRREHPLAGRRRRDRPAGRPEPGERRVGGGAERDRRRRATGPSPQPRPPRRRAAPSAARRTPARRSRPAASSVRASAGQRAAAPGRRSPPPAPARPPPPAVPTRSPAACRAAQVQELPRPGPRCAAATSARQVAATSPSAERAASPAAPRRRGGHRADAPGRQAAVAALRAANCSTAVGRGEEQPLHAREIQRRRQAARSASSGATTARKRPGSRASSAAAKAADCARGRVSSRVRGSAMAAPSAGPPLRGGRAGVTCGPRPAQSREGRDAGRPRHPRDREQLRRHRRRGGARPPGPARGRDPRLEVVRARTRCTTPSAASCPRSPPAPMPSGSTLVTAAALDARRASASPTSTPSPSPPARA